MTHHVAQERIKSNKRVKLVFRRFGNSLLFIHGLQDEEKRMNSLQPLER